MALFVAECNHWFDFCGAPCRHGARKDGHHDEDRCRDEQDYGVLGITRLPIGEKAAKDQDWHQAGYDTSAHGDQHGKEDDAQYLDGCAPSAMRVPNSFVLSVAE